MKKAVTVKRYAQKESRGEDFIDWQEIVDWLYDCASVSLSFHIGSGRL